MTCDLGCRKRGEQPGAVVERLNRKGRRLRATTGRRSGVDDSRRGLNDRVEPTSAGPRPHPIERAELNDDGSGRHAFDWEAACRKCSGAVSIDPDVRIPEQTSEVVATIRRVEIGEVELQPWKMRDFVLTDPSGVLWRIAQNV